MKPLLLIITLVFAAQTAVQQPLTTPAGSVVGNHPRSEFGSADRRRSSLAVQRPAHRPSNHRFPGPFHPAIRSSRTPPSRAGEGWFHTVETVRMGSSRA
jgi:hypothetical protein